MPGLTPRAPAFELLGRDHRGSGGGPFGSQLMNDIHGRADPLEVVQPGHACTIASATWRSLVREPGELCEGTAFFCDGAELPGLASRTGVLLPGAPMSAAAARGLASGQKNAVLRRDPLAAATKLRAVVRVLVSAFMKGAGHW